MTEKTMTLAEALSLKKSFERKIEKRLLKIKNAYLLVKPSDLREHEEYYDKYCNEMRATYQSLETMNKNYVILCSAITMANAKTKTDMVKPDGDQYTIAELLSIRSNNAMDNFIKALTDGHLKAESRRADNPGTYVLDPFGADLRIKTSNEAVDFEEKAGAAIQKANVKKKITVSFID